MLNSNFKIGIARFRMIAICEGISYLVLLFIAMPLKYIADLPQAVLVVGWIHGFLFIAYMFAGLHVALIHKWDLKRILYAFIASLLPFGPFILDQKILSKEVQEV